MAYMEELTARVEAGEALAAMLGDSMLAEHLGGALGCTEAETVAEFVRAWGTAEGAETWLDMHAIHDDEGDDHYERGQEIRANNDTEEA